MAANPAGYSGTPLVKKLGIKPGMRVCVVGCPGEYAALVPDLPEGLEIGTRLAGKLDFIHFFTKERAELEKRLPAIGKCLEPDGMLWISWPKKASKVLTDISEDLLRQVILPTGLVDVKVCAVDAVWSGLKFMWRRELR